MFRHRRALPALAAAGLALAGCGGSASPDRYVLEPTRDCLAGEDVATSTEGLDFVASTALGGALIARPMGNRVVLAFGDSAADAARTVRAYRQFAGKRIPLQDLLFQEKNTVLLWEEPPTEEQARTVGGCLEG
ncbi:MAG TPA: hypothetical protein VLB86_08460 [Gaiellaceae bacterium]|nr:hypothetical protein [Gaiellaceae bacterium]